MGALTGYFPAIPPRRKPFSPRSRPPPVTIRRYSGKRMARLLLFAATTGYQTRIFADAAKRLGLEVTLATDRCHVLEDPWGDHAIPVRFEDPEACRDAVVGRGPFDAV